MRKKTEQLQELVSEAEDVYRQMVAAKGQITVRMAECFSSLQNIQHSLLTLTGADVAAVLAKLKVKEVCMCCKVFYALEQCMSFKKKVTMYKIQTI